MSKYSSYARRPPPKTSPWKVHPVWRGIGCLIMIMMPLMAYAGAVLLLEANKQLNLVYIPPQFSVPFLVPRLGVFPVPLATILVTLLLMFVGFAGLMIVYALLYRFLGGPLAGPLDAPLERPPRRKRR